MYAMYYAEALIYNRLNLKFNIPVVQVLLITAPAPASAQVRLDNMDPFVGQNE